MQANVLGAECRRRRKLRREGCLVEETLQSRQTVCGVERGHGVAHSLPFTGVDKRQGRLGGDSVPALFAVEIRRWRFRLSIAACKGMRDYAPASPSCMSPEVAFSAV